MPSGSLLIIEDDRDVIDALKVLLEDEFREIASETNPNRIPALLSREYDMILLDMNFSAGINSGNEGLYWLSAILKAQPEAAVIMLTAYGHIDLAVDAIKRGARDFVLKPWDNDKLLATVTANLRRKKDILPASGTYFFLEGTSPPMLHLQDQISKVAATDASVLILGENGTGKELIARRIHQLSARSGKPFVTVDASAIPENLFESELFGHKKGAFTDAKTDKAGRFEQAHGGTLFLDEIGNLSATHQMKLLTVLQNRKVMPVGGLQEVSLDVRLISATNAPIGEMVKAGKFRQDLLYRVNTITLTAPPLRDRGANDIVALANHFLEVYRQRYGKRSMLHFDSTALESIRNFSWPGNVRELQHTIEKAVIMTDSDAITAADLSLNISSVTSAQPSMTLDEMERQALQRALREHEGNIVQAAKALGITRQTLYNKMKKYGL